jgi:cytochrome c peroxidase
VRTLFDILKTKEVALIVLSVLTLGLYCALPGLAQTSALTWNPSEHARILSFGPWPSPNNALDSPQRRQVNPLAGHPNAIALGERLFADTRLSANGRVACETCHQAKRGFTDGRATSIGLVEVQRNAMPLFDLAEQRWFGWDGGADSLWAASIRPLLDPREMGNSVESIAKLVSEDKAYSTLVNNLMDLVAPDASPRERNEKTLVIVAMSLAAWMETIESERGAFDRYRDALSQRSLYPAALAEADSAPARADIFKNTGFSPQAERGLKIFIGKGKCWICHGGPRFTHGEFHDIGRPFMVKPNRDHANLAVDPGRYRGIERVKKDPFNLLGRWSSNPNSQRAQLVDQTVLQHRNWGEWKIPSLRNLKQTAPYMHDGSLASLRDVVLHYSDLNEERLHADGEALLKPLRLTEQEVDDLVAFLESLSP